MAQRKVSVSYNGKMVDAIDTPIKASSESWCEYELEDGAVFRIKATVANFARIEGEFNEEGQPIYVTRTAVLLAPVTIPENLRKKAN